MSRTITLVDAERAAQSWANGISPKIATGGVTFNNPPQDSRLPDTWVTLSLVSTSVPWDDLTVQTAVVQFDCNGSTRKKAEAVALALTGAALSFCGPADAGGALCLRILVSNGPMWLPNAGVGRAAGMGRGGRTDRDPPSPRYVVDLLFDFVGAET